MSDSKNSSKINNQHDTLLRAKVEEYLAQKGIVRENTTLVCFIDGAQRQPDLIELMFNFAKEHLNNK